jgi:hypothetical protein
MPLVLSLAISSEKTATTLAVFRIAKQSARQDFCGELLPLADNLWKTARNSKTAPLPVLDQKNSPQSRARTDKLSQSSRPVAAKFAEETNART